MSATFQCGDNAALIGYLYGECDPRESASIEAHMAGCRACANEVAALQATREELRLWNPPDVAMGFTVVPTAVPATSPSAVVLRPARWWSQPLPAWAQAAAAVVLFAAGAALGAYRGTVVPQAQVAATQATPAAANPGAAPSVATGPGATAVSMQDLAALESRLRSEMARAQTVSAPATGTPHNDAALLQQVRTLIQESEQRQQRELTLRAAELVRDVDAQRRGDLARIERTFGQMEGTTGVQVEQQRQLLNYLMRVSQRQGQ